MKKIISLLGAVCIFLSIFTFGATAATISGFPNLVSLNQGMEISSDNFSDGLISKKMDNKFGYVDINGNIVIEFRFDNQSRFSEGLAPVCESYGLYGYINTRGEYVIPPQYLDAKGFEDGRAIVSTGDDSYTIIDKTGKVLTDTYSNIYSTASSPYTIPPVPGYTIVKDGKAGFMDKNLKVIVPAEFSFVQMYSADYALVINNESYGIYDIRAEKLIVTPNYYGITEIYENMFVYKLNGRLIGVKDFEGNEILTPLSARTVFILSDNSFLINYSNSTVKITDRSGTTLLSFDGVSYAEPNEYGNITLYRNSGEQSLISPSGNTIIPPQYDQVFEITDRIVANIDGKSYLFDKRGNLLRELNFEVNYYLSANIANGYLICNDELYGACDNNFNIIIPLKYVNIYSYGHHGIYYAYEARNTQSYELNSIIIIDKTAASHEITAPITDFVSITRSANLSPAYLMLGRNLVKSESGFRHVDPLNPEVLPLLESDRTLVPIRCIYNLLVGAAIEWHQEKQIASFALPGRSVAISPDSKMVEVYTFNEETRKIDADIQEIDVPARIINDRTFIPLRAVSELLGINVAWHPIGIIGIGVNEITNPDEILQNFNID